MKRLIVTCSVLFLFALAPAVAGVVIEMGSIESDASASGDTIYAQDGMLRMDALATGGKAIIANPSGDLEVKEILKSIDQLEKGEFEARNIFAFKEQFQWFLLPAILLLLFEPFKSERTRTRRAR